MTDEADPLVDAYFMALALPPDDAEAAGVALARAHELRKFEIENYWKRATYFWAFQLAAFSTLGLLWKIGGDPLDEGVLMVPAALGAVTALVGWLTAQGSKFWQENWEGHVDALEDRLGGRLTQVIVVKHGLSRSVSRVNEALLGLLTLGWSCFAFEIAFRIDKLFPAAPWPRVGAVALLVAMLLIFCTTKSRLPGWRLDPRSNHWRRNDEVKAPYLILRDTFRRRPSPPRTSDTP